MTRKSEVDNFSLAIRGNYRREDGNERECQNDDKANNGEPVTDQTLPRIAPKTTLLSRGSKLST